MSDQFDEKNDGHPKGFADAIGSYFQKGSTGDGVESFADLLDSYSPGENEDVRIGDKVKGEIISIGKDTVFVNTGTKIDGAVDKTDLLDENGELPHNIGDVLDLYIISLNENEIRLSKALSGVGGLNLLQEAFESGVPVEGKVTEQCKGGFHVEMMQRTAFCPVSQIDAKFVKTPEDYVGQVFPFIIARFEEKGKNIIVSRRTLIEREQKKAQKKFLEDVSVGSVLEGKVTSIMPYGVFMEIFPGIEGMVHVSELGWSRVENPGEVFSQGDTATVKLTGIEPGKKPGQLKISLSIKQLTGDPWDSDEDRFHVGEKVKGKVTRCADFGAFVEIAPGIEGLVHISQMSYKKRVLKSEDIVKVGETIDVMIKDIKIENRRISLSIRDAEGDPWVGVKEKYRIGQAVEGTIEKKEKFGYFITLEPGITGLLPKSKISKFHKPSLIEKLKEGEAITIFVEEIHPNDRKITLGPGDSVDEGSWKKYTKDTKTASLGSLGEKLQQALDAKK